MRQYTVTVSLLAALLLGACAQESLNNAAVTLSPDVISASNDPAPQERVYSEQTAPLVETSVGNAKETASNQGFDPRDITPAELDELKALQKKCE